MWNIPFTMVTKSIKYQTHISTHNISTHTHTHIYIKCIYIYIHYIFFIHLSADGRWVASMSWLLWAVLLWTLRYMCLLELFIFSRYMHRSRAIGSFGNSNFSFLRNFHTILCSVYTNFHSHKQCKKVPFLLHSL